VDHRTAVLLGQKYELEHSQAIEAERLARVEERTAEYNLSLTTLRSPIDGHLSYLIAKPGEILATGAKAFTVVDTSDLEARLYVPQKELSRVRVGLRVRILCEVFPGKEFEGAVEVVNPVVDKSGTVEVLVGIRDKEGFLKPGMFVNGEIILDVHQGAVLVSKKAISYENQEPVVFLVKDGVAHRYGLEAGYRTRTHVEVLGLVGPDGKRVSPEDAASGELGGLVEIGHSNLKEGSRVETDRPR
jgi:RND family efflux transporter MFP subunit